MRREEDGFSLIELLVVVIVIGILAAIAVPLYVHQRDQAVQASMRSDLRDTAVFMESYYADNATYPTSFSQLSSDLSTSPSTTITVETSGSTPGTYCLTARNTTLTGFFAYDSAKGGLQAWDVPCS